MKLCSLCSYVPLFARLQCVELSKMDSAPDNLLVAVFSRDTEYQKFALAVFGDSYDVTELVGAMAFMIN